MTQATVCPDVRLVVFDWDGTLFDSTGVIGYSLQQACKVLGFPVPSLARAQHVIGLGFCEAIENLVGSLSPEQEQVFIQTYRRHYFASENMVTLFVGMNNLLARLKQQNLFLAIATGKSRMGLNRVLQHNPSVSQYFISSRTADETQSKPHPQMLLELLEELNVRAEQAVMIGDTTYDIEMARAAQMSSIAVVYGAHSEEQLLSAQPSHIVKDVPQLAQVFGVTI